MKRFIFIATGHYHAFNPGVLEWWTAKSSRAMSRLLSEYTSLIPDASAAGQLLFINHRFAALGGEGLVSACFWETEPSSRLVRQSILSAQSTVCFEEGFPTRDSWFEVRVLTSFRDTMDSL